MSFDFQPTLKGEILELRPLRAEDFDDLYAVASDPLIWEQHPIRDRYKEDVFKEFFREALESECAILPPLFSGEFSITQYLTTTWKQIT
jgi:N-acetyltransferase